MQAAKREAQPHVPAIVKEAKHAPDVHGEAHLVGAMLLVLVFVLVFVIYIYIYSDMCVERCGMVRGEGCTSILEVD